MEKLLLQLLEAAKKDKKQLIVLKNLSVKLQQFELSINLREIEKELYPESKEDKFAKEQAQKLNLVFRMVGLNVSDDACWLISETLKDYTKRGSKFSINDATALSLKHNQIFDL